VRTDQNPRYWWGNFLLLAAAPQASEIVGWLERFAVLWRDGRIVAVIDWEEAAFGDPMADLANSWLEIVWHFGTAAMTC
jgi:aminoglycoside phosphotransferase (APT) family kinase protein